MTVQEEAILRSAATKARSAVLAANQVRRAIADLLKYHASARNPAALIATLATDADPLTSDDWVPTRAEYNAVLAAAAAYAYYAGDLTDAEVQAITGAPPIDVTGIVAGFDQYAQ